MAAVGTDSVLVAAPPSSGPSTDDLAAAAASGAAPQKKGSMGNKKYELAEDGTVILPRLK
jgi:hypothetical protein